MHASGKLILRLCGGVCNKQRRWKVRVVVELDPGFCFMVNKPHECPDVPQLLKRFFLAPYTDPDAVAMNFFRLVAVCLLYTSPNPRDRQKSRMPSSA